MYSLPAEWKGCAAMPDEEEIANQQALLNTYRRNLARLVRQAASYGGEEAAPINIANNLDDARANIGRIKDILRGWSVKVDDLPDENAPAVAPPAAQDAMAQSPNSGDDKPASSVLSATTKPKKPRRRSDEADVYISYHEADETWVSETLLPKLEAAGLRVMIDYRDFAIGVPRLVNIERAVERSRHTLIVMTPEWVESDWNAFQGLLASSEDPSGLRQKLLPLKLRPCTPPARIAMIEILDLTNLARREAQIERLVRGLTAARTLGKGSAKSAPGAQPASLSTASQAIATPLPSSAVPAAASTDPIRALKEKYLASLYRKLEAAYSQKSSTLSQVDKVSIGKQIEQLEAEIEQIKRDLR
jgi:hypothetical protein